MEIQFGVRDKKTLHSLLGSPRCRYGPPSRRSVAAGAAGTHHSFLSTQHETMTTTTHITASCLITVLAIKSGLDSIEKLLVVALASFVAHLIIDLIPHGFIADPSTIFKKIMPTLLELAPGPVILLLAIAAFGNPILFCWSAAFGILPDIVTTLVWKNRGLVSQLPGVSAINRLHRKVHWFETDHPDGTVSYRFPNRPMLALESLFIIFLLLVLFIKLKP